MKDISTTRALMKAVKDLEASLILPYKVHPENPETDFLNAASSVAFFSRIVFKDLVARQGTEISARWAFSAAIALGDLEEARRFLRIEIDDIKSEGLHLDQLRESTELLLRNHGRSERWSVLLSEIAAAY
ncbi:hypothetical protein [Tritonibacter mobilis]|uniref:hypothetical protein n=1 Tax=Tritonibacter mobilis TaxID=379347 RepID=UPI001403E41D|nr:hypothetical protein [Tritonibacter mobilis]NHM19485.1 hypothetical protein [Tritonibacter mobilis]NHM23635.1 hypothetical protein [Tritonibacter mobilis]